MKIKLLIFSLLANMICFAVDKYTTATVGTWSPAGNPATTDDVYVQHDWSAGWAAAGGLSNAYAATITIENGGNLHITNALANFAGTMTVESGGVYEIDGDMTNWTGDIDIQSGGAFIGNWNFNAGDDAFGASLNVDGTLTLTAGSPQGVLTLDLVVTGTGVIDATTITLNGNGSTGTTTLPVELINFTAESTGTANLLKWTTASEINNSYFEIQKSLDGLNFTAIGQVEGNGNSFDLIDYQFEDYQDINTAAYYRLKQVDYDGVYSFSHIVNTNAEQSETVEIIQNANSNNFFIVSSVEEELALEVIDINGRLVHSEFLQATNGSRHNFNVDYTGNFFIIVRYRDSIISKQSIIK